MRCVAIVLSGGIGSRMNMNIPKQYIEVADHMIITDSIRPFVECDLVSDIQIVADSMWHEKIIDEYRVLSKSYLGELDMGMGAYKFTGFSLPGENRQLSVLSALRDIAAGCEEEDIVIVHDAARPLISIELIERCINAINGHDGVMPVLPMKDTVYYSDNGLCVTNLLDRDRIFAGQAPEVFRTKKYLEACESLLPDKIMEIKGSTEPAIMAGMDIVMIPGDEKNIKITTKDDLERYKNLKELSD